jgi:hypothetical protein
MVLLVLMLVLVLLLELLWHAMVVSLHLAPTRDWI